MKKFFAVIMTFVMAFILVGCNKTIEFSFDNTSYSINIGDEVELKPTIINLEGEDLVKYEVADTKIVSVTGKTLKGLKEGKTTITASLKDHDEVAAITLNVTVTSVPVRSVKVKGPNQIFLNQVTKFEAVVLPENASNKQVAWSSSDEKVATIDKDGNAKALKTGEVTFKATIEGQEATIDVEVIRPNISAITIVGETKMEVQTEQILKANVLPEGAKHDIQWKSSDSKIATVNNYGTVKAVAEGEVTITAIANDKDRVSSTFKITITTPEAQTVTVTADSAGITINEEKQLTATVTPANASQKVTWKSSDDTKVTVSETGVIKGVALGEATITATASNGKSGSIKIIVGEIAKDMVLVDDNFKAGDTKEYEGRNFVFGINAFATIKEAINAVDVDGTVIVLDGTYDEELTITKKIKLFGNNANVNPNTQTRKAEANLTNVIKIGQVNGLEINGFALTGAGQIQLEDVAIEDLTISYMNVYDKGEATSEWSDGIRDYSNDAAINFAQSGIKSKNLTVSDSKFDVKDYAIKTAKVEAVNVLNCTFQNFERDAIRVEGGLNAGKYTFSGNKFTNGQNGHNAIFVHYYGNGSNGLKHELIITNNIFKDCGKLQDGVTYTGAISSRGYQEGGANWEVSYNTFENCPNYILVRNNATADNHAASPWTFTADYNKFIGEPEGYYFKNRFTDGDNESTAPAKAIFTKNIYLDKDGKTVIVPNQDKFKFVAANRDIFDSLDSYTYDRFGTEDEINYLVDGNFADKENGTKVVFGGVDYFVGKTAFSTVSKALEVAPENAGIYVFAGTYSEEITISKNGIKLYGPNGLMNPNMDTRVPEAFFDEAPIILGANVKDVKIQGIQINGKTKVDLMNGGIDGLTIKNCLFTTKNGAGAEPVIAGYDVNNKEALTYNVSIINNRFESATNSRIVGFYSLDGLLFDGNYITSPGKDYNDLLKIDRPKGEIIVKNNYFVGCGQDGMFIGLKANAIKRMDILNNVFDGCGKKVDYGNMIDIRNSSVENAEYNIMYNTFKNGADNLIMIQLKQATALAKANVNHNKFYGTNAKTIFFTDKTNLTVDIENNYFEDPAYATKISGLTPTKVIANAKDVEKYPDAPYVTVNNIKINTTVVEYKQLQEFDLDYTVEPTDASNKNVVFTSSDSNIALVNDQGHVTCLHAGKAKIIVTYELDDRISAEIEITVVEAKRIEATVKGETILSKNETATLEPTIVAGATTDKVNWTTSNDKVLTVDEAGVVKAVGKGEATITGKLNSDKDITIEFTFTVVDDLKQMDKLLQQLVKYHNSRVLFQNIHAAGEVDYETFTYGSVNMFDFEPLNIDESIQVEINDDNRPGTKKLSIEYITIHNTDNTNEGANARGHANYVRNHGGGTSWGYSVGNDGIYKQMPDDEVSYHAGDGSRQFKLEDTGVKVTVPADEAKIGMNAEGFFTINGQDTKLRPYYQDDQRNDLVDQTVYNESQFNKMGFTLAEQNGNYYMNRTYFRGGFINSYGGNRNSIGMETMVDIKSNLELTQHRAAKLASNLCIKYKLPTSRIVGHHFFAGKNCPQTLMENNLWDRFKAICDAEYDIQKNYADYKIEFESLDPEYLASNGMVIKAPAKTRTVSYTITVSKGELKQSVTLRSIVPGILVDPLYDWVDVK